MGKQLSLGCLGDVLSIGFTAEQKGIYEQTHFLDSSLPNIPSLFRMKPNKKDHRLVIDRVLKQAVRIYD